MTREAIGAVALGVGAGGEKWPLCNQLTTAVAQLPLVLLFHLSLLSRVFGSHTTFYCLPDLTTLEHDFFIHPFLFYFAVFQQDWQSETNWEVHQYTVSVMAYNNIPSVC